jgi:ATP-dependent Lon protease
MLSQKIKGAERFLTRPIGCESRAPHSRIKLCYLESGEFSRGKESIRAEGGVVMVGNFDVDVQHQQRVGPLPPDMRHDTAFMDRIHAYLPGWDLPIVSRELLTDHFGLVSNFLSECWNRLRRQADKTFSKGVSTWAVP